MVDGWIAEGDAFLLVFSIIDPKGFNVVDSKRARILKTKEKKTPPMILLGNKCDLAKERLVPEDEATAKAKDWGVDYMEVSAKVSLCNNRKKSTMRKHSLTWYVN